MAGDYTKCASCFATSTSSKRADVPSERQDRENKYDSAEYRDILGRISANARRLRDHAGWSQEKAASECGGMSTRLYQFIESAQTNVTAATLAGLCKGFGVDVVALLAPAAPRPKRKPGRPKKRE